MKKDLYENYLLMKYLFLTMKQVNTLESHEKDYYIKEINKYLDYENKNN